MNLIKTALKLVIGAALVAVPVATYLVARQMLDRYELAMTPYKRDPGEVFVTIEPGTGAAAAVRKLAAHGIVADARVTLALATRTGQDRAIRAGEYRFVHPATPAEVLGRLVRGDVVLNSVTIPEGLHRYQVAARVEAAGIGTAEEFLRATASPARVADLDPDADDLEGYLFPDTYALGRHDGAEVLVDAMVAGFRRALGPEPHARAAAQGLTVRQVVALASLVEKETARADERPLVAGVYRERLRRGMLLQADPTVIYGLIRDGVWDGDLKRKHLRQDHPYNTYVRPGLPPGPIASPGKAALDASFAPADTDYLYFVSKNDGSHVFARSLREHNRNVDVHQRRYWREKWRKAGGRKKFLEQQQATP